MGNFVLEIRRLLSVRTCLFGLLLLTTFPRHLYSADSPMTADPRAETTTKVLQKSGGKRQIDAQKKSELATSFGRLPLTFEENVGQTDPRVKFLSRGPQFTLFLTASEAVFAMPTLRQQIRPLAHSEDGHDRSESASANPNGKPRAASGSVIRMRLVGASREAPITGEERTPGKRSYFIGNDPKKWHTNIALYSQTKYSGLYPGIDLIYRGERNGLEFDYVIEPNRNPKKIALAFDGQESATIDPQGDLVLSSAAGELRFHKPVAYQEDEHGNRNLVEAQFEQRKHGKVGFALGAYDHRRRLIIDPSVIYATYLGGSSQDEGLGIALDSSNNVYVTGATMSMDFPTQPNVQLAGGFDVFVTAFDASGNLIFSYLYGGATGDDIGTSIAVNDSSSFGIYVTGSTTSSDFPVTSNAYQLVLLGQQNAFLLQILSLTDPTNFAATYLGGSVSDTGTGVTVDDSNNVWIVGKTTSPDFGPPTNPLPGEDQINLGQGTGPADGFVSVITNQCGVLVFSSFLGGSKDDFATGVSIDDPSQSDYHIYISGATVSPDFFTTLGVIQPTCGTDSNCNNGKYDGFVTSINWALQSATYHYSTFLGGSGNDQALSIAADLNGGVYLTGLTASSDFPLNSVFQSSLKGTQNAFVASLDPLATQLVYSTYLGGSGTDSGLGITIDGLNNAYVTGRTNSPDFPVLFATQPKIGGGQDAFISSFEPSAGGLTFSTFLGGSGDEDLVGGSIAVDSTQNVYVTGDTNSADFPTYGNIYQVNFGGSKTCTINGVKAPCEDAFVAKINVQPPKTSKLTVQLTGSGTATVSSTPAGIDCTFQTTPCSAIFADGTQITLTEIATDTTFNGWGGACSGTGPCVLTLNSDQIVTADFSINASNGTLQVNELGTGTGTVTSVPTGIDCTVANPTGCTSNFAAGVPIILSAVADKDSTFAGWGPPCVSAGTGQCMVSVTANSTLVVDAYFTLVYKTLNVSVNGPGLVSSKPAGIVNCGNVCSANFQAGTVVTLTAQANHGAIFVGWNGGGCSGTGDCVVTMNSDQNVSATFNTNTTTSTVSVSLEGKGVGTVISNIQPGINCPTTCSATFPLGTVLTLVEAPDSSSTFSGWSGDASSCGTNTNCTLTLDSALVGVVATFTQTVIPPPPVTFTLASSPTTPAVVASGGSVAYGLKMLSLNGFTDTVSLTCAVQPASGVSCSFSPSMVNLGANQGGSSTLTINAFSTTTTGSLRRLRNSRWPGPLYAVLMPFLGFGIFGGGWSSKKRKLAVGIGLLLVLVMIAGQTACGRGGSNSSSAQVTNAQPGSYTVTVTATGATTLDTQSIAIPVTVQ